MVANGLPLDGYLLGSPKRQVAAIGMPLVNQGRARFRPAEARLTIPALTLI